MNPITYKDGYQYQLKQTYRLQIPLRPQSTIDTPYIQLDDQGWLTIEEGYAWDGPSGPTIATPSFMRGSLVHDALYQLMREQWLDHRVYRAPADRLLQQLCREDGMWAVRAWWIYQGVRFFADPAADPASNKPALYAPG